jgi:hypothetical protein
MIRPPPSTAAIRRSLRSFDRHAPLVAFPLPFAGGAAVYFNDWTAKGRAANTYRRDYREVDHRLRYANITTTETPILQNKHNGERLFHR